MEFTSSLRTASRYAIKHEADGLFAQPAFVRFDRKDNPVFAFVLIISSLIIGREVRGH